MMLEKKNIGVIIDNDFYNDPRVPNQVKILSEKYNVHVLCFSFSDSEYQDPPSGFNITSICINKKLKNFLFGIQNTFPIYDYFWVYHICRFIKDYSLESIHVHDLFFANIGRLVKKRTNTPFILDLHEDYPVSVLKYMWTQRFPKKLVARPKKWAKIERKLLSYPDKIVVLSSFHKKALVEKYNLKPENIAIYSNVPDLKKYESYQIDNDIFDKGNRFIVFYFGVISKRRGILTCINAVNNLRSKYPFLHLLLIGPVDKAEIEIFKRYLNTDHITHFAWKDISLLPSYMNVSDICVSPILFEGGNDHGLANKVFQYALYKKPILASNTRPHTEFIDENNCGMTFVADDSDDLATKIEFLFHNREKCIEYGENGHKAVIDKYNTDTMKANLFGMYAELVRNATCCPL